MTLRKLIYAWLGLMALLALTTASSFVPLAGWNASVNLAVAIAKTAIIVLVFMEFTGHGTLVKLTGAAIGLWLLILYALTLIDRVGN